MSPADQSRRFQEEDSLESPLREAVDAVCLITVPDETILRSVQRAQQIPETTPRSLSSFRKLRGSRWRAWIAVGVGVAAMFAMALLWLPSQNVIMADVIKAVSTKPWMRATGKGPGEVEITTWFSPQQGIFAIQQETTIIFLDSEQGTIETFETQEDGSGLLTRRPLDDDLKRFTRSQQRMLEMLIFGNPLRAFKDRAEELVSYSKIDVTKNGKKLIEHRITTKSPDEKHAMVTILQVDPETRLPQTWEATIGQTLVFSCRVDYPERGPETMFAFGLPDDVQIVDQTPGPDQEKILSAWKTGRTRFDSYRAVVVFSSSDDHDASGHEVFQVWRDGLKWRVEQLRLPPRVKGGPNAVSVPDGADHRQWWLQRGEEWETVPKTVSNGQVEIRLEPVRAEPRQPDPRNPRYILINGFKPVKTHTFDRPTSDPNPDQARVMPEYHAYPFLFGETLSGYQVTVNPRPDSGPEKTSMIESKKVNVPSKPGRFYGARYWYDSTHGNVVKQMQWLQTAKPDAGFLEMRQLEKTPSGFWYPTVVRELQNSIHLDDGTKNDTYIRFYVDFEPLFPEKLFDVDQWGTY